MSKRCSPSEFKGMLDKWSGVFTPVSARSLGAWQMDFEDANSSLHYMAISKFEANPPMERMLSYRSIMGVNSGVTESVQADLEKIWSLDLARGLSAYHTFVERDSGFEYRFMAVNGSNEYITGRLIVLDRPKE